MAKKDTCLEVPHFAGKENRRQQTLLYASRFPTAIFYRKVRGYTDHLFGPRGQAVKTTGKSIESKPPFPGESHRALLQTLRRIFNTK